MKTIEQKSIKFNFLMNIILTMSSFIFPLITFPYISRILLPAGMGRVSFATSLVSYFSMFAQLGIPTYGIRACAKVRDNKEDLTRTVHELMMINLVMCVIVYGCFGIMLFSVPRLQQDKTLFLVASTTIILNIAGVEWLYKALEKYTYITVRSIIFKVIALGAMFLMIHEEQDYIKYGAISIFASSASNILNLVNIRKYIYITPMGGYNFRKHLKAVWIFFAMAIATTIYTNLDTVMLGFMKSNQDVGYYNAAVKTKSILVSIVTSLGTVLLPRASYYLEQGLENEFRKITEKALNFVVLFAIPMMIYFIVFAKYGIMFLSGPAYNEAILPMQIIMPTLLFIGMTNIMGIQMLVPMGKEKYVLYSVMAGAIIDLILNIILIPKYASTGAAIGTGVAEMVVLIYQSIVLKDIVVPILKRIRYLKLAIGLLAGLMASVWIIELQLSSFFTLVISGAVFFSTYGIVLLVLKESLVMELVGQILGKYPKISNGLRGFYNRKE